MRTATLAELALWRAVMNGTESLGSPPPASAPVTPRRRMLCLDLHELSVCDAYARTKQFLTDAHQQGHRSVKIVTGRSGQIRREFATWLENSAVVRSYAELKGGGAFVIKLKKTKQK